MIYENNPYTIYEQAVGLLNIIEDPDNKEDPGPAKKSTISAVEGSRTELRSSRRTR